MEIKQFDNVNQKVIDDLREQLSNRSKISIAAASFSIYAYEALKKELESIKELRFIFTSPTFNRENNPKEKREFYIPKLHRERNLYGSEFEIKLRNQLSQKAIARECADWIRRKVSFKTNISEGVMNGFLNVQDENDSFTYLPFNEFTTTELGCERGNNICPGIMRMPAQFSEQYIRNFNELWNDTEKFKEVTETVIENITTVYKENAPDFIYFITLYNIFKEFLEDLSEDVLPNEATGFKNSVIWQKLYNFQHDAALAIINKLEKYNGCILADSVGLGKTFTALAVIKYYEARNKSVLVLCPKKLYDNWATYNSNYVNNPLAKDRFNYDILYHSDLSRERGMSNGIDLQKINWNNYDLVVIDESHNFRNGGKVTQLDDEDDTKENRYLKLMNRVIRSGVRTKVLMLSATPVNNRFNDLKNQLQLAYEGDSKKINDLLNTSSSIDDIFRQAQTEYNKWTKLPREQRTTANLLSSLSYDFFEVLDSVTIARSRRHIEQYYDTSAIGKFPKRKKPISRRPKLTDLSEAITFNEIYSLVNNLNLAIYTPSDFIFPSAREKYMDASGKGALFAGYGMAGREKGIRRLMSINVLKRLESSVNSFRLTLERIRNLIQNMVDLIESSNFTDTACVAEYDFSYGIDFDEREDDVFIGGKKTPIRLQDMDYVRWKHYLDQDLHVLGKLLSMLKDITPDHDSKLQQLIADLRDKFEHPINGNNKKVLIFTAFSDTALYLYENLAERIKENTGLNVALVTGDIEARSTLKLREKLDFNKALTLFSPKSKDCASVYPTIKEEIDVLIGTDCISEGQNLQDCDYLINYDIHWNPVRIIQRFGRIDRIGSTNDYIQLVNYWPDMTLDEYINLKERVEARMKVSVMTSTGDDNPISDEEKGDLEYRREQLKRLQEEVVDLEEMNTGVSIMDLGLNEFRLDLLAYLKEHPNMDLTPFGMNAVVESSDLVKPGVIYILKNRNNGVNIDHSNLLHPFYMVYISHEGEVICDHLQSKKLLDTMRYACKGKTEPDKDLCKLLNKETRDGRKMDHYSELLQAAIASIITVKEESDIDSLFSVGETSALMCDIKGLDDFELITFLIIK